MKKISRKDILYEYKLPHLPDKIFNYILKELKNILKEINTNLSLYNLVNNEELIEKYFELINFKQRIEYEAKLCFIKSIIMLIGEFNDYTFYLEEKSLFNKESFIDAHKDKDFKNFLNMFVNTNLFKYFLEEEKVLFFSREKYLKDDISFGDNLYPKDIVYSEVYYFNKISERFHNLKNNNNIKTTSLDIFNIIKGDIKTKADKICNNLNLIDNTLIDSNKNTINQINNQNDIQSENDKYLINKKKTNVLFSGKNYLEDKTEDSKKKSKNIDLYYTHGIKDSKLSSENTTLSTYFKVITKTDNMSDKLNNNDKLLYIDTNIQKKGNISNKNKKNDSEIKKYLLAPYFLRTKFDDEFYIKELKDEEIILNEIQEKKKKKLIKNKFPPCTNMLYRNLKPIENNNYLFKKEKIYIIQNDNDNIEKENCNKDKMKYKYNNEFMTFKNIYDKKNKNEKEISNLKELFENDDKIIIINKIFQLCFEQKFELKDEYLSPIKKIFLNIENLEYYLNLIVPDNFLRSKNNIFQKPLTASSFNSFSKIIKIAFESFNLIDNNLGRLLTLACFIYYKFEKDKIIYLYSEFLFNKLDKSQKPYLLWNNESFWIEFFNLEFELNNKEIELRKENIFFSDNENKDDSCDINKKKKMCLIKTVMTLSKIMLKLNINMNFVVNIIEKMILPVFINDFYFIKEIMNLALLANK